METLKPPPSSSDGGLASVSGEPLGSWKVQTQPHQNREKVYSAVSLCGDFPSYLILNI